MQVIRSQSCITMKIIIIARSILTIAFMLLAGTLSANPIYMQYEGVDGSVTAKVEVRNGKAALKKLKPGTYNISLIFTGKDAKTPEGRPRSMAHVKVFDGRSMFAGGVRVAVGDVTGDGSSAAGTHAGGGGGGAGKVSMRDFSFSVMTVDGKTAQTTTEANNKVMLRDINVPLQPNGSDVSGKFGSFKIAPPAGSSNIDSFFDVFTELTID